MGQTKKLAFVGWRGMVGRVLGERFKSVGVKAKRLDELFDVYYMSTSQAGQPVPEDLNSSSKELLDAKSIDELTQMDIVLTCQGGDYTMSVYSDLRAKGWDGYWIDAASALRMDQNSVICLSPINSEVIDQALNNGIKTFVGGNCTVSLLLMATAGLFKENLVEWMSTMTYQAASGAGAKNMLEMMDQMKFLSQSMGWETGDILEWEEKTRTLFTDAEFPNTHFGSALAGGLIPWIDSPMDSGQTREEWKAQVEANKILGLQGDQTIPIDGTCVRVSSLRCHAQAVTVKLSKSVALDSLQEMIGSSSADTIIIENTPEATRSALNPAYVSGTLDVPVGRIRKMTIGDDYLNLFTCADQLLWGAAEPLRCMLEHLV